MSTKTGTGKARRPPAAQRLITSIPLKRVDSEALDRLFDAWLTEEAGSDGETWPELKKALQQNRGPGRKLFHD
jgi:hypothetical protein